MEDSVVAGGLDAFGWLFLGGCLDDINFRYSDRFAAYYVEFEKRVDFENW